MSKVQVDKVVNLSDDGAPQLTYGAELPVGYGLTGAGGLNITGVVTAASAVFSGNVTIGGTLTYEDVTNIDVVGVSTFAGRMNVNSSALFNEGLSVTAGVTTIAGTSTYAGTATYAGDVSIADKIIHTGDTNTAIRFPSADTVTVETSGSEAIRVDSSQRLVIGATSSNNVGGFGGAAFQVEGLTAPTSAMSLIRHSNDAVSPSILMGKSRGTSDGATTIVQDDDVCARIIAYGADGNDTESSLGAIQFDVDGTPGSNDMPGRIVLSTTADGAATYTERLRITSAGNIGINETSPGHKLVVGGDGYFGFTSPNDAARQIIFNANRGSAGDTLANINWQWNSKYVAQIRGIAGADTTNKDDAHLAFFTSAANNLVERLRIKSNGKVGIGTDITGAPASSYNFAVYRSSGTGYLYTETAGSGASAGLRAKAGTADFTIYTTQGTGQLAFYDNTNTAERLRIDSSGQLLVGTTAARDVGGLSSQKLAIEGTDGPSSALSLIDNQNSAGGSPSLSFAKSRGTSVGSNTIVQDGDTLGSIVWCAADGNDIANQSAKITCTVDAAPGSNDTAGRLKFLTSEDGSSSPTSRLEINKDGHVYVKTGSIVMSTSGQGINFAATSDGGGMTGELLDDYEKGDFTATCANSVTLQGASNQLAYVKVGSLCHVQGQLQINSSNSNSDFKITNLPFAATNPTDSGGHSVGAVRLYGIDAPSGIGPFCIVYDGGTDLHFRMSRDNTTDTPITATDGGYFAFSITYRTVAT